MHRILTLSAHGVVGVFAAFGLLCAGTLDKFRELAARLEAGAKQTAKSYYLTYRESVSSVVRGKDDLSINKTVILFFRFRVSA